MLYNWAAARGTRQIQAAGVVLVGAPESIAIARQARAVLEALATAQRQGHAPAEILAGLLVDGHVPIELLARVLRGAGAPAETLALLERRARATIEALTDVTRSGSAPVEVESPVQTVSRAAGVPIETLTGIRRQARTVIERRATRPAISDSSGWVRVRTGRPPFTPPPRTFRVRRQTGTAVEALASVARRAQTELDVRATPIVELPPLVWVPTHTLAPRRVPVPAIAWRPTVPARVRVPAGAHRRSRAVRDAELLGCIDAGVL